MDANFVKSVVYGMIENGDLRFELEKGNREIIIGKFAKTVPIIKLKVLNNKDKVLMISELNDEFIKLSTDELYLHSKNTELF